MVRGGRRRPLTLGVFTAELDDSYQVAVWRGMEERARELGAGMVTFLGSRVHSPVAWEEAANVAYRIADPTNVDGIIIVASTIATFLSRGGLEQLFERGDGLPLVSVGAKMPGIPSLSVDGTAAIREVVRHLVQDHGRRRFAIIDGPVGHPEGELRSDTIRRALATEGVEFDEQLSVAGSFLQDSGAEGTRRLIELGADFDALVCLNDRMALGAMPVLEANGRRVGEDVSVVGFDGIEPGRYVTPPLSTVVQPLREVGRTSVDTLVELIEGGKPEDLVLSCRPTFRQSCGCPPARGYDPGCMEVPSQASEEERLAVDELADLARRGESELFVRRLNRALSTTLKSGSTATGWNDLLSVVRNRVEDTPDARRLFEFARVLIGEVESRMQAEVRTSATERSTALLEISASLAASFELPVMLARLETGLLRLGVGGGYLALFDGPGLERSRLLMHPHDSNQAAESADARVFTTTALLPPSEGEGWRRSSWVLEPLVFQHEPLGYLLFPGGAADPAVYDTLREQVSGAIKGALLLEQVRSHEHRLEAEVERRTAQLTQTNAELRREIEERVRLEEEVVDISNRTMQRIGQDIHDDLCQQLAGTAMFVKALRERLDGDPAGAAAVDQIGGLLSESVVRAKQIARGLFPSGLEKDGLSAAIEELVAMARQSYPALISFRSSPDFALADTDRALQVYRIVQEALSNALKHSGSERVEVRLRRENGAKRSAALVAEVVDYGTGLPAEPSSGTGMGMRIMRYRAEQARIDLTIESLERGTRVSCRLE